MEYASNILSLVLSMSKIIFSEKSDLQAYTLFTMFINKVLRPYLTLKTKKKHRNGSPC